MDRNSIIRIEMDRSFLPIIDLATKGLHMIKMTKKNLMTRREVKTERQRVRVRERDH